MTITESKKSKVSHTKQKRLAYLYVKISKIYGESRAHFRGKVVFNVSLYKQTLKKKLTFKG